MDNSQKDRDSRLLEDIKKFGNRTSSFVTAYPHFRSFTTKAGTIRYVETKGAWVGATEPLAPLPLRAEVFQDFHRAATEHHKIAIMFPITGNFAGQLTSLGFQKIQVGAEPVFTLHDYFGEYPDPLDFLPVARTLKRRGAKVREVESSAIAKEMQEELSRITDEWLASRKVKPLRFLSEVSPLCLCTHKRVFILEVSGAIQAFLTAVPFYGESEQVEGYFFLDNLRTSSARAASMDLLIIETMKLLHGEGIREVRLGNCPLAHINDKNLQGALSRLLFNHWQWGYNFKSLYAFKAKFRPTGWEPLYLAGAKAGLKALFEMVRVHFPKKNPIEASNRDGEKKNSLLITLWKIKWTLLLSMSFILIHILRLHLPGLAELYKASAYIPGQVTWQGLVLAPFFHNHAYHLIGDQLSFLFFGAIIEWRYGARQFWIVTALGLWASNPATHLLVGVPLSILSPEYYQNFLLEKDYGSSNAVYALVGALGAKLSRPEFVIVPFAVNGLIVSLNKKSFLTIHHFTALAMGFFAIKLMDSKFLQSKKRCNLSPGSWYSK